MRHVLAIALLASAAAGAEAAQTRQDPDSSSFKNRIRPVRTDKPRTERGVIRSVPARTSPGPWIRTRTGRIRTHTVTTSRFLSARLLQDKKKQQREMTPWDAFVVMLSKSRNSKKLNQNLVDKLVGAGKDLISDVVSPEVKAAATRNLPKLPNPTDKASIPRSAVANNFEDFSRVARRLGAAGQFALNVAYGWFVNKVGADAEAAFRRTAVDRAARLHVATAQQYGAGQTVKKGVSFQAGRDTHKDVYVYVIEYADGKFIVIQVSPISDATFGGTFITTVDTKKR